MKGCGPNLTKYMKQKGIDAVEEEHSEASTDGFDLPDGEDSSNEKPGPDAKIGKKGQKNFQKTKGNQ